MADRRRRELKFGRGTREIQMPTGGVEHLERTGSRDLFGHSRSSNKTHQSFKDNSFFFFLFCFLLSHPLLLFLSSLLPPYTPSLPFLPSSLSFLYLPSPPSSF